MELDQNNMAAELNSRSQSGFANALNYDAYRPSYPQESLDNLLGVLGIAGVSKACIVDLGAGTGKLTEQLAAKAEEYDIVAVDPHSQMLEVLRQKHLPRVRIVNGTAASMAEVGSGWADAVLVAQNLYEKSTGSSKPVEVWDSSGILKIKPATVWEDKLKEIIRSRDIYTVPPIEKLWQDLCDSIPEALASEDKATKALFSAPISSRTLRWTIWMSKGAIWNRYKTLSQIAVLDIDEQELSPQNSSPFRADLIPV
ncbi:hypothetical protein G7Y89_g4666 [Cudoniella acicularis]|uniref:Methyltransferase domain-containing protein n=1 Tax=Cudoniella acicularis TaxID=354080 RepID=A0A8H4RNZ6_9HELO|nr:hypothetical protein G7Y89_g4666 [Cudoniella acicularis]